MSSKDDPSGSDGRTVIRGSPRRAPRPDQPSSVPDPTIIYTGDAAPPAGTVIFQGVPFGSVKPETARHPARHDQPPAQSGISQDALIDAVDGLQFVASNPIMASAAPLLMLLGHLRSTSVELDASSLAQHVATSIDEFEWKVADAGVAEEDAHIARYALCETADDVIANLPGIGPEQWAQHSLLKQFYRIEAPGDGFFEALNSILADPAERCDLLELMHACLSLGFQGPFRRAAGEADCLETVRQDVYDALRYFRPRPDDEISPHWQGMAAMAGKRPTRLPLWVIAAAGVALVTGAFFWMRSDITSQGDALAAKLLALTPTTQVAIRRAGLGPVAEEPQPVAPVEPVAPAATGGQIDRVRAVLAQDIQSGGLTVEIKGVYITVEINNSLLFETGKADTKPEFAPVASRIAAALAAEPGAIRVVGHTDNVKPRQSGTFKSNYDLSVARAEAVAKALAPGLGDATRLTPEGKGEDQPVADNATPEGRALNRRVDIMLRREETP
ncbi:type IV / vi secretion system protein, dotu family [Aminobacter sp. DSM 101952]|uniref:type VI secretion system protein TssL, long form n=1 Tax=Aminobacter sp. DSM 101952 TaxID=2735891 RepID=UPI0006F679E5|nr:type VI secretion system protein TssL, long form [Aminobacter sp. DSM 101952]KQU69798.1 type IV / vi secretion system protein, dotu family [Aminobacter sp. DSM 101952]